MGKKDCQHDGRLWIEGDTKWRCLDCDHEETHQCEHPMKVALKAAGGRFDWCPKCKRAVGR